VFHEGYGGWKWENFLNRWQEKPGAKYGDKSSPFVFSNENEAAAPDVARYIREQLGEAQPQVVTFLLGINDCFGANPESREETDAEVQERVFSGKEPL